MIDKFQEMVVYFRLGLHETGYIICGEPFLSIENELTLNTVILPVIRRVYPTIIANDILGVQPMTGPVGLIHTLRTKDKC